MAAPPRPPSVVYLTPAQKAAQVAKSAQTRRQKTVSSNRKKAQASTRPTSGLPTDYGASLGSAPPPRYKPPLKNPWPSAVDTLTTGVTPPKKVTPKPVTPTPRSAPTQTPPHAVDTVPTRTLPSSAPSGESKGAPPFSATPPPKPHLPKTGKYMTTRADADRALPPDVPGSTVKFTKGKGYYIDTSPPKGNVPAGESKNQPPFTTAPSGFSMPGGAANDPITSWVNAAQLPQLQQIQNAQAASQLAAKNAATTTTGYYGALGGVLKGIGPATESAYSSAAGADSAFAKGFSDGLAHVQAQEGSEASNILGISGGEGQAGQVNQAIGGKGATDALYNVGGYIPATSLNREGAAFTAAANQLPATAAGIGAQDIAGINAQQRIDQQGFTKQFSDLAAQVPGLRLQFGAQLAAQDLARQTRQDKIDATAQHEADVRRQQAISMIVATGIGPDGKLTPKAQMELAKLTGEIGGKPTLAARTAQSKLDIATAKTLSELYGVDEKGNLTLAGQNAARAEWKAHHPPAKGGFTKNQIATLSRKASADAEIFRYGKVVNDRNGNPDPTKSISLIPDYQDALRKLIASGVPLTIAQRALNTYWPVGNDNKGKADEHGSPLPYGRPYLTVQMREVLQAAGESIDAMTPPNQAQVNILAKHGITYRGPLYPSPNPSTGFRGTDLG